MGVASHKRATTWAYGDGSVQGTAAATQPRVWSQGPSACFPKGPVTTGRGVVLQVQPLSLPSPCPPCPAGCNRSSSRMVNSHVHQGSNLIFQMHKALEPKTKHKAFPRCFPNARDTLGWKNGAPFPLIFNRTLARPVIKRIPYLFAYLTWKDNKLEGLHKSPREFLYTRTVSKNPSMTFCQSSNHLHHILLPSCFCTNLPANKSNQAPKRFYSYRGKAQNTSGSPAGRLLILGASGGGSQMQRKPQGARRGTPAPHKTSHTVLTH